MNHIILSSDVHPWYSFYTPLTSLLWQRRGDLPVLLLVGTVSKWLSDPQQKLALEHAREVSAEIHFIPEVENVRTSTVAQVVRCFGATLPHTQDDDYLLTSDVDMWPLGPWVGGMRDPEKKLQLYFSNAYNQSEYPHWPMAYVGANAKTWREITGCSVGKLQKELERTLAHAPTDESGAWNYDERFLGEKITFWANTSFSTLVQEIPRTFVRGEWRIDRSAWDKSMAEIRGSLDGVADAHLPRPGYTEENWNRIRPLLEILLPRDLLVWADTYRRRWLAAEKNP